MKYAFAIHGGAGTISKPTMSRWKEKAYKEALLRSILIGTSVLEKGGKAIDAVFESVKEMEDSALFNAGRGSVFSYNGEHEMDAALMDGKTLQAGAVTGIKLVKNPILLAQKVMQHSKHILLGGDEALEFARTQNIEFKPKSYFYDEYRYHQWQKMKLRDAVSLDHDEKEEKFGTVGAVALDKKGNLAAATSTGGMVNKRYGRIGDSPILGSGTYANNDSCAVSCTGHGEYFLRLVVAHELSSLIRYEKMTLAEAAEKIVHVDLKKMGGRGGLIAIDKFGNITMPFNTKGMYRAYKHQGGEVFTGIYKK